MTMEASISRNNTLRSQDRRPQSERCLGDHEVERLGGIHAGDAITCTNGVLWVTQEGDPEDYLLKKGERFVANRFGLVLVQAFEDAACRWYEGR